MQGKAAFFGSQMDKFTMFVFSIALIFCVATIQAAPTDPNLKTEGQNCCPIKMCSKLEFRSEENYKMDFVMTHTSCGCDSTLGQVCVRSIEELQETLRFLTAKSQHFQG